MTHQFDGYNYLLRLNRGELLVDQLVTFAREQKVSGGWIGGVGAAMNTELGFYDLEGKIYKWKKLDRLLEIVSLQGNIAWKDDQPVVHLHGVFSDEDLRTYGGHVKELSVGGTCEIFVHIWNKGELGRIHSQTIGLNLLDL